MEQFFAPSRRSGKKWLAILVIRFWAIYDTLWHHRNQVKHAGSSQGNAGDHSLMDTKIDELYKCIPNKRLLSQAERKSFSMAHSTGKAKTTKTETKMDQGCDGYFATVQTGV